MDRLAAVTRTLAALVAVLAACADEPPPCPNPFVQLRNPETIACVTRQAPGPACPLIGPLPPWPVCKHPCETIRDEAACIASPGCRVAREDCNQFDDRCALEGPFVGCYPVDTDPPVAGDCTTLDAFACATRDDCGAQYLHGPDCPLPTDPAPATYAPDGLGCHYSFVACFDELHPPPP